MNIQLVAELERRGIDRLVGIVAVSDVAIFLFLGFVIDWMVAGIYSVIALIGLLVLTLQRRPSGAPSATDNAGPPPG